MSLSDLIDKYEIIDHDCKALSGVSFDFDASEGLSEKEVRIRWPRKNCPECKRVVFFNSAHKIFGGWWNNGK